MYTENEHKMHEEYLQECDRRFRRMADALRRKYGLDRCWATDGLFGKVLHETEPYNKKLNLCGWKRGPFCCFSNGDRDQTEAALRGPGKPGIVTMVLSGDSRVSRSLWFRTGNYRMVLRFRAPRFSLTENNRFKVKGGGTLSLIGHSPLFNGTEFESEFGRPDLEEPVIPAVPEDRKMTVAGLIGLLKEMPQDATVAVKYRDEGGPYSGCDYDVTPVISEKDESVPNGTVLI